MNIIIYSPDAAARAAIARHLIDVGNYRMIFADSEENVVSLVLHDDIKLTLLFDPPNIKSITNLKDFIREKRRMTCVRILPSRGNRLHEGWQRVVVDALKPIKSHPGTPLGAHPRFHWKPTS